jgi:hypothetical protein
MGANEATPADAARGAGATTGASAVTVQWATAAVALAPTAPGGYEDTPVGRLPTGPAADAALAAAATSGGATPGEPRTSGRRRALAVALVAGVLGAAAAVALSRRRGAARARRG